jgi:hypothetical protein
MWPRNTTRLGALTGSAHVEILIPPELDYANAILTADGRSVVLRTQPRESAPGEKPRPRIYVRRLDQKTFQPIRGTEGALGYVLSPDSRWVLFLASVSTQSILNRRYKVPIDGSAPPVPVVDVDAEDYGGTWLRNGDLLISIREKKEYIRIDGRTGARSKPIPMIIPDFNGVAYFVFDSSIPHDRGVLLQTRSYDRGAFRYGIVVLDLKSGKARSLIENGSCPHYAPTGHLLFTRGNTLMAAQFDLARLEVAGEPVAIMGDLGIRTARVSL